MSSQEAIKERLATFTPTDAERSVIKSAMFNFITMATVGAAALGMSAKQWGEKAYWAVADVGTFTGLTLGGALGMDNGMQKLRESLPADSQLLAIIRDNDRLKVEVAKSLVGDQKP
ncbi:hypothetical protein DFQ28_000285 [Apophysomyces sp. BC1034]|nr:hypothetical protein DFQ30_008110 [Apophysomyces sp. BC1015]KAG0191399.1 hypothetical protein DFQ28_000285 [Apophysomyces sp. BC1034]